MNAVQIGVPTGIRTPVLTVKGWCPRPLDDGDASLQSTKQKTGGARRDRTADLLHAMQALSQLSYGPTWRRGTLPDTDPLVKNTPSLGGDKARIPPSQGLGKATQALGFAQDGKGGVDGRRHRTPTQRQPNRLRHLAEG